LARLVDAAYDDIRARIERWSDDRTRRRAPD
jgi:hypothetical protein